MYQYDVVVDEFAEFTGDWKDVRVTVDIRQAVAGLPSFAEAWTSLQLPATEPLPAAFSAARVTVVDALRATLHIPDSALTKRWTWPDHTTQISIRIGLYLLYQILEEAAAGIERVVGQFGSGPTQAGRILGQATAARWDLHGLLLPLGPADLDRPPGGGEWTLRETLAHTAIAQALYTLSTAYWARQPRVSGPIPAPPELPFTRLPDAAWLAGTLQDHLHRLDTALDLSVGLLGRLNDDADLDKPAVWAGHDVTVRFRLHLYAMHLREHTIQVEKTLVMLGRQPTEVERIARITLAAYGHLERSLFGVSDESLDRVTSGEPSPSSQFIGVIDRLGSIASILCARAAEE
jgi:hypothetical protein